MPKILSVREDPKNGLTYRLVERTAPRTRNAVRQALFQYLRELKSVTNKEILRKPKSGRTYIVRTKGGRRRRHIASAPGETHANRSGKTRRSLSWKVFGWDKGRFGYGISTNASNVAPPWAVYMAFDDGGSNPSNRPSLENGFNSVPLNPFFNASFKRGFKIAR